jgi:hypothetical protein
MMTISRNGIYNEPLLGQGRIPVAFNRLPYLKSTASISQRVHRLAFTRKKIAGSVIRDPAWAQEIRLQSVDYTTI